MRCHTPFGLALMAGLALAAALLPTGRAVVDERPGLLRTFAELRKQAQKNLADIKVRRVRSSVPSARGEAEVAPLDALKEGMAKLKPVTIEVEGRRIETSNMVKVWAVLADSGRKVSLTRHEWKPNERFYLWFETTAPVRFALHQTDPGKQPVRILPKPKYTDSYTTILPGKPYRLPVRLKMLDTDDDETVTLSVVVVGSGPDPDPVGDDREIGVRSATDYCTSMDALLRDLREKKWRMKPVDFARPGRDSSDDADDVCLIAIGERKAGFVELTMRKAR